MKPLKRAFGIDRTNNNPRQYHAAKAEEDECIAEKNGESGHGLLSPSRFRTEFVSSEVVQVVDGKKASFMFVPEVYFETPGQAEGTYVIELSMLLTEGNTVVPLLVGTCQSCSYAEGDAFIVQSVKRQQVPNKRGKMKCKMSRMTPGGKAIQQECFSFNFKLNPGIHGHSNIGVRGASGSFVVMDLRSSVYESRADATPDVQIERLTFFVPHQHC